MYIVFFVMLAVVVLGWTGYGIYHWKEYGQKKDQPRPRSERLENVQKSLDDYAKQMAEFGKKKPHERRQNHQD